MKYKQQLLGIVVLGIAFLSSFALAHAEIGPDFVMRAPASSTRVVDSFGNSLSSVLVDQQVQITTDVANGGETDQPFIFLAQVADDSDNSVVALGWITGTLTPGHSFSPSQSWIPEKPGMYVATLYIWESLESSVPLSPPTSITIDVVTEEILQERARQEIIDRKERELAAKEFRMYLPDDLPAHPEKLEYYKVNPHPVSLSHAITVANSLFGVKAAEVTQLLPPDSDAGYIIEDTSGRLELYENGKINYTAKRFDTFQRMDFDQHPPGLKPAYSIAEKFLELLYTKDLVPKHEQYTLKGPYGSGKSTMNASNPDSGHRYDIDYVDVAYRQIFAEEKISHGADEIRISIDQSGNVIAFYADWRHLIPHVVPSGTLTVNTTPADAVDMIVQNKDKYLDRLEYSDLKPLRFGLHNVELTYGFEKRDDGHEYLVPFWSVDGYAVFDNSDEGARDIEFDFKENILVE